MGGALFAGTLAALQKFRPEPLSNPTNLALSALAGLAGAYLIRSKKTFIPCALKNGMFDKVDAPALQQQSGAEAGHVKNMADAGGCKGGDVGAVKHAILKRARYTPEPTTSGYLRWLHIYDDAVSRGIAGENKHIIVLGPGRQPIDGSYHCPQIAESLGLWRGSDFTVLDSNSESLDAASSVDRRLAQRYIREAFRVNEASFHPSKKASMEQLQKLILSPDLQESYRMRCREFRMGKDLLPNSLPPADAILATFSLFYPMKELAERDQDRNRVQRVQLLSHYLSQLKPGGVMYVEKDCLTAMLANATDLSDQNRLRSLVTTKKLENLQAQISADSGLNISFHRLPPITQLTYQDKPFVIQPSLETNEQRITQTTDAYALVREN